MYSLMNTGKNYFCNLLSEQVLTDVMDMVQEQQNRGLLVDTITSSVLKCILEEPLVNIRIFMDTTGILHLDSNLLDAILYVTLSLLKSGNEVFYLGCSKEIREELKLGFRGKGHEIREQHIQDKSWYLEIGLQGYPLHELSGKKCAEILYEIHYDNLRILVTDGPKGKSLDMKRLLKDEDCIYYYCYRLTRKMADLGLVSLDPENNRDICLIAGNEPGHYVAKVLSKILGNPVCVDEDLLEVSRDINKYIIVRDVIHMYCELNKLNSLIKGVNGLVVGACCLIDINTGVGNRNNRASYYTIDIEKGIGNRLRLKKKEDEGS